MCTLEHESEGCMACMCVSVSHSLEHVPECYSASPRVLHAVL